MAGMTGGLIVAEKDEIKTKDRILKAAIDEFVEYGFYGARTQNIANRAKVNKAMLHYYFRNKENIYDETLKTLFFKVMEKLNNISDEPVEPEKKMDQILDAFMEIFTDSTFYPKLLLYEIIRGGDRLAKLVRENLLLIPVNPLTGKIYKYFKNQMKTGKIKRVNIYHLLISLIAQVVPVYGAKALIGDKAKLFGIGDMALNKFVRDRKKFVLDIMKEGVLKK